MLHPPGPDLTCAERRGALLHVSDRPEGRPAAAFLPFVPPGSPHSGPTQRRLARVYAGGDGACRPGLVSSARCSGHSASMRPRDCVLLTLCPKVLRHRTSPSGCRWTWGKKPSSLSTVKAGGAEGGESAKRARRQAGGTCAVEGGGGGRSWPRGWWERHGEKPWLRMSRPGQADGTCERRVPQDIQTAPPRARPEPVR